MDLSPLGDQVVSSANSLARTPRRPQATARGESPVRRVNPLSLTRGDRVLDRTDESVPTSLFVLGRFTILAEPCLEWLVDPAVRADEVGAALIAGHPHGRIATEADRLLA
jgi:hypothetical protein